MFLHNFRFELRYRFTQPSTYLFFGVFALFAFLSQTVDDFGFNSSAKIHVNSPDALGQLIIVSSILGMFVTAAVLGTPIYRDDKDGMTGLLYTTPLTKPAYLLGRFLGSLLAIWFIYSGTAVGALLGMLAPWVEASKLGPVQPLALLMPLVGGAWANALFAGSLFFAAYLVFRSPLVVYLGGIALFVLYQVAMTFIESVSDDHLFAQLDPFGLAARNIDANYWTIAERNTKVLNFFAGELVQNRLLWTTIGLVVLAGACAYFRLGLPKVRQKKTAEAEPVVVPTGGLPRTPQDFGPGLGWWQVRQLTRVQLLNVVRAWPFRVLALLGVVFVLFNVYFTYQDSRGILMPVTYLVLKLLNDNFTLFFLLIITIYAGELVWRERDLRLQLMFDALPFANWVPFVSKLLALLGAVVLLCGVMIAVGVGVQLYRAPALVEPLLYLQNFALQVSQLAVLCVLALTVQTVVNQKYVGHAVMMVYYGVVFLLADALGLHHVLLKFGGTITYTYSDMNGYGHLVAPLVAINLYYLAGTLLLALLTALLWVRGNDYGWRVRRQLFAQRLGAPGARPALLAAVLTVLAAGGWVFYNANVLNRYLTPKGLEARQAAIEQKYKRYEWMPQPKIVAIDFNADLYPTATPRGYRLHGTYTLLNRESRAIDTLYLNYDESPSVRNVLALDRPARVLSDDPEAGIRLYRLARPLAPGDSLKLRYEVSYRAAGFTSRLKGTGVFDWASISPEDRITANGSFVNDPDLHLGYQVGNELNEDEVRQRNGLKAKARALRLTDPRGRMQSQFATDADMVRYQATVSTDADQIAVAPGYLAREWVQNGRRYFHYRMDQPIAAMISVLSARYRVHRETWQPAGGGQPVAIEIYHDPKHAFNVRRMAEALRKGLPYYTAAFGPYQFRQIRILEFPRYKSFAQSFPNTVPFSESAGFISDLRDKTKPDLAFFITNHELGHQWWGHQVSGANVQGSSMLVESLAEYSAIMTAKHEFSPAAMQQFMRRELDQYLRGRRQERQKELPLMLCEDQPYIHYYKGGMVFYALQDYIGEAKLNGALRAFLTKYRYQTRPYPTTADLMPYLRQATPDSLQYVLRDMFETITLHKNELKSATYTARPDGRYDVALTVRSEKMRADSLGNEASVPTADYVDIGIFGPDQAKAEAWDVRGKALLLRKVKLTKPETTLQFVVNEKPAKAGIDPYQKLIDRYHFDNVKYVQAGKAPAKAVAAR